MSSTVTDILDPPQDPSPALQFGTFFVYCMVVVVVMLFFFFYFNRAIASLLSRFLGYWCWRTYKAHIEVESIKIALLGGRISFRNLRYVAENQSIAVLQGHITFRYWKSAVRDEKDVSDPTPLTDATASPSLGPPPNHKMCRIGVRVKGVEWCMYNRTPVFDWIEEQYKAGLANEAMSRSSSTGSAQSSSQDPLNINGQPSSRPPPPGGQQQHQQQQQPSGSSWFRDLFPIEFMAGKGCISIGNPSLPTVLILDWRKANGSYSIVPSRSLLDQYKSLLQIAFHRGQMQFRANVDYVPPPSTTPDPHPTTTGEYKFPSARKSRTNPLRTFARWMRSLFTLPWRRNRRHVPASSSPTPAPEPPGAGRGGWMGLNRYRAAASTPNDNDEFGGGAAASAPPSGVSQAGTDQHVRTPPPTSTGTSTAAAAGAAARGQAQAWTDPLGDEYAQVHKVVEFVALGLTYYADTVGLADPSLTRHRSPSPPSSSTSLSAAPHDIGNGDLDPEWGVDLVFYGAQVNYGPWADRQRAAMQRFFFPFIYRNAETSPVLSPGEWRVHPNLRIYIRFVGRTVWRVPVREPSKDVKLGGGGGGASSGSGGGGGGGGTAEGVARGEPAAPDQQPRAYGWLDISFAGGSATINVPMLTQRTLGSTTTAHVHLDAVTLATSVNYVDLLASRSVAVNVAMPSPQLWNAPRTWDVVVALDAPVVHLLRDHITLVQDLVADWGAVDVRVPRAPGHPLGTFVPFTYRVKVSVKQIELRLCVNELNVIDVPNDLAENNYYIIHAQTLAATVTIPLTRFQPTTTPVSFSLTLADAHAHFSFSPSSTLGAFTSPDARDSLRLARTTIAGAYTYHAVASTTVPDVLEMSVDAHAGTLTAFGFLARYLILLVDNYVGLTPEYMTLDEFKMAGGRPAPSASTGAPLDTCVSVTLSDIRVVLPEAMYVLAPGTLSEMHTDHATMDVRITPVLMDLQLDIWPVEWVRASGLGAGAAADDRLVVSGFSVHGHRMFGLPPVNPEYAASWRVSVEKVEGGVSVPGLMGLGRWAAAFDAQMDDFDNRIAHVGEVVRSVMQVGFRVGELDVVVRGEPAAAVAGTTGAAAGEAYVHVVIAGLNVEYADLALLNARTDLEVDCVVVVHVLVNSAAGHTSSSALGSGSSGSADDAVEIASVRASDIAVHLRARPDDNDPVHQTRVGHIQVHDALTGRLAHLFGQPSVAADAGCGWFAPPFVVDEVELATTSPAHASGAAADGQHRAAVAQAGPGSAAEHYFKSLHSEGDLLQVPGLVVPDMNRSSAAPPPLVVDADAANADDVDRGLLSTPSSDSSTSLRSFATAPDYDQPRGRASTHASSTYGKFGGGGSGASGLAAAGGSTTRVRIAVPAVDSSTSSLAYRHYLRTYHAASGLGTTAVDEEEEEEQSQNGLSARALFALLQSSLQSGGKLMYVECLGSMDIVLTPASLEHAPSLIVDTPTCDLLLDSLYLGYLKDSMCTPPPATPPPPAMISAVLRKISVTLVQDCASSDLVKSVIKIAELDAALGVDAIQLHVHGAEASSTLLPVNPIAALSGPSDADTVVSASLEHVVFHGSTQISGTWTGIEVNVAKPDLIPGMLSQWHVPDLSLPSHAQAFLSLASAIPAPIVRDPSFLAQPSNLWRLGVRPHQHNPTWRLLCLFRAHLQSPLARSQLELELASNGMQAFPESRLSMLLQTWKFTPATRPGMPLVSPFAFLWAPPEDSELDALIQVAVNKARSHVQLDLTKAKITVEDSWVTLSGIHIASRAGEQVFVHTERVGVTVKPGMLAQVKRYIDNPELLFPANGSSVSPKTTTSAGKPISAAPTTTAAAPATAAAAASSNKSPDRHFVASIARVDVDVLSPKLSLHLKLRGAMASTVICTHTVPPIGLQASSSSTAQTAREPHTSVSWAVDSGDATLVGSNPLAVISIKDCSGVSGNKHLARVETVVVDLPQNILQLYTFIDEWKSYLEPVINVGAAAAPAPPTAGAAGHGKAATAAAATRPTVNKDVRTKPFGGIDFIAPNVVVSLGALPSLTVISRTSAALHFSSETAWMLDVSRNDLGFLYAGEAAAVYVTLPIVRVESRGARINVVLGVLQGTVSSETLQPIETSLSLLSREINDVLELLLFLSPKLARSMQQQPSTASTQSARPGLPSSKPAASQPVPPTGVRISCDGVSLSMVTTRGVLQVHSDLITGSKMGDTWSFDSSQLSLAFLSLNRTMLSQVRFALSLSSSATLLRLGLSRFEMMVQPKAMLQLVDLVAFIAGETAVRKKAKEAELNQLSSTTQKVMESLDVKPAGGSSLGGSSTGASSGGGGGGGGGAAAMIGKRDVHMALDLVSCNLLVDAHHSTELTLQSATLWRKSGEFDVIASDLRLAVDGSSIVFPGCHVLSNAGSWTCQVHPCQLTIQSHLLPSVVVIFDETTNALVSAQTLASSFLSSSMETVPSIAATSSGQVNNEFANIPVQIDFLGGKGTIIDSSITIPSSQLRLNDGLLWLHVSSSHNVLLPSAIELFRSLMDAPQSTRARTETSSTLGGLLSPMPLSPMPATPRSETMPDMHSSTSVTHASSNSSGTSLPFQVLFVLEPTTIDLKGRKSKCLAQLQFSTTVHVDPAPSLHVSALVPTLSFGIHHPFASEDCVTMRISDTTFAYSLESGLLGQVPSVELKILLRHFLEIREWIDEWTAELPMSSMASTAPPESPSASRSSRQLLTEPLPSSPHGTSVRSSMQFDSAPFDFPHSLIKFGKVEATVQMGQAIGLATVTLPDLFMFAEHRTAHFSSNLAVAVNGRVLSRLDLHAFHATLQFQGHQTMVEAGIERILGTFQYQTAMTTVVDVATVGILLVARGLSADLDIRVGDSVLLTSARAAPAVLNVMQRFKDLVGLSASPSATPAAAPSLSPFGGLTAVDPRFSGHITVLVSLISLHVYGESLMEREHIMATVHRPLIHVTVNGGDPVHRVLKTHVDKIKLIKVTLSDPLLVVPPADVAGWVQWARGPASTTAPAASASTATAGAATGAAGLTTTANLQQQQPPEQHRAPVPIPHRQTKLIAQVPKSDLSMTTWTVSDSTNSVNNSLSSSTSSTALLGPSNPGQVVVRHVFTTQFDGMIDLALNMILYRNLQDVIDLYESEISRTMRTLQIIAGPSHEEKAVKYVLEPVEPPVLVPRLRVMGEATPPLEWLVKKELVPEMAHTSVTLPLDGFLRSLASSFS